MNTSNRDSFGATKQTQEHFLRLIREVKTCSTVEGGDRSDARARLIGMLERLIVDRAQLHHHIRQLRTVNIEQFETSQALSATRVEDVLTKGLGVLNASELVVLALEAATLRRLHDEVLRRLPTAWLDILEQEGSDWLRLHGRTIPSVEQIIKEV
jgi:hypothetical protein